VTDKLTRPPLDEMTKAYEPAAVETKWYHFWLERGYFMPKTGAAGPPFTVIMPPPNVTGELHMGHALTDTMEDIMVRWHRMKGEPTLWLPGFDHSGIAAQVVVERLLAKEGITRQEMGREKFTERMMAWADQCRDAIRKQHQRLGASCDWTRERFTLDESPSRAVRTTFVRLFQQGLIYRGERIINWCPRCLTALSDLEVGHKDIKGHLYYLRYPLADDSNDYIIVATTRPETMLGDTAVAVNPMDPRFRKFLGRKVRLPLINRVIPVVADEAIDVSFGTGAVKVTPFHDPVDFEIAQRHCLERVNILEPGAKMNYNAGPYAGLDRFACRKAIIADLDSQGLLEKVEPYTHAVGHCDRCQTVVEPIASQQWFVRMAPLAGPALAAVTSGQIKIVPEHFTKVYVNWLENIRDWCISRQLWWGHRIPVWYCLNCNEMIAAVEPLACCTKCGSPNIHQDQDVLDTWFSSGLWPHSTLGWPEATADMRRFYPSSVMETGYDILFFWVARMIMMGLANTGTIPFTTVYLHGLIRDEKGEKMSKVKGNVINPLEMADKYGTDALRFSLSTGTAPGNDIKLAPARMEAGRNFANKLWNASRFVLKSLPAPGESNLSLAPELPVEDRWILGRLDQTVTGVTSLMEEYQFGEAQRIIYEFLWGDYCDWYIEMAKIRLRTPEASSPLPVLVFVLEKSLRLLHPYMPYITEELWQHLSIYLPRTQTNDSIMVATYPTADAANPDVFAERIMSSLIEIIHAIRNTRAQYKVENNRTIEARIYGGELETQLSLYRPVINAMGNVDPLIFLPQRQVPGLQDNLVVSILKETEVIIPIASMVDAALEIKRLDKEMAGMEAELARLAVRLGDPAFLGKAPPAVVAKEKDKAAEMTERLTRLKGQRAKLS
jgi:valyl-tRNA synthetase